MVETIVAIGAFALFCLIIYFLSNNNSTYKSPPGPWSLPIFGSLLTLLAGDSISTFAKYKAKYGNIFQIRLGSYKLVVLNDFNLVRKALAKKEFSGRPNLPLFQDLNIGHMEWGIVNSDSRSNPDYYRLRQFTMRTLKDLGFGKSRMEKYHRFEAQELCNLLRMQVNQPINLQDFIHIPVVNGLWQLLTGNRFKNQDTKIVDVITDLALKSTLGAEVAGKEVFLPNISQKLNPKFWREHQEFWKNIFEMMKSQIETSQRSPGNFISKFLGEYETALPNLSHANAVNQLTMILKELFVAGIETTGTTLMWAILYIAKFPVVQQKLEEELEVVVGCSRCPTLEDIPRLVYMEAVISEVHRKASILPLSAYHETTQDVEFAGYYIQKGTIVAPNLYECHHDKSIWEDPDIFRPERFLDSSGNLITRHDALIPFSAGKRRCIGETMARDNLFILLSFLVHNFKWELVEPQLDYEKIRTLLLRVPNPFKIILHQRR